jgi:hypothetical protein
MAAGKSDQILVRLLDGAKARAKARHGPFLEGDHATHRTPGYARRG